MRAVRWSDNDKYFGPFTYCDSDYKRLAFVIDSGGRHDSKPQCHLRMQVSRWTLIIALPPIIRPWKQWVDTSRHSWSEKGGGFWDTHPREYGFSYHEGFLQVFLGRQTMDSSTTQSWNKHLPWTQWRHVRHSLYGLNGEHYWTFPNRRHFLGNEQWEKDRAKEDACPVVKFEFEDYDGKRIIATSKIEEREWLFGEGWFKWLSIFRNPKIRRSLDLKFSEEVGPEKGSWKGGTIGHGIDMLPGELHEEAFKRYCEKEHSAKGRKYKIKYIGLVQ